MPGTRAGAVIYDRICSETDIAVVLLAGRIQGILFVRLLARNAEPNTITYNPNSLRIGTGNLIRPCRELIRAIREFFRLIRESRAGGDFDFTATLNRVSDQLAHDEQGAGR
jgi:hypothetical protein